jgi:hypothetical protein
MYENIRQRLPNNTYSWIRRSIRKPGIKHTVNAWGQVTAFAVFYLEPFGETLLILLVTSSEDLDVKNVI